MGHHKHLYFLIFFLCALSGLSAPRKSPYEKSDRRSRRGASGYAECDASGDFSTRHPGHMGHTLFINGLDRLSLGHSNRAYGALELPNQMDRGGLYFRTRAAVDSVGQLQALTL